MRAVLSDQAGKELMRIERILLEHGWRVDRRPEGAALGAAADVVVLAWPVDLSRLAQLRRQEEFGLLLISGDLAIGDRLAALDHGADDIIPAGLSGALLVRRVMALLRLLPRQFSDVIQVADLTVDLSHRRVCRGGRDILVTQREFQLLVLLARQAGMALPRSAIIESLWAGDASIGDNAVDALASRLRRRIDGDFATKLIKTVRGVGYCLTFPQPEEPLKDRRAAVPSPRKKEESSMSFARTWLAAPALALSLAMVPPLAQAADLTAPSFHLAKTIPLGGADKWDYLAYEQASHRLFVAHGTEVSVVDGQSGARLGAVSGLSGVHGIALVPELGRGYISNNGHATVFDLTSLKAVGEIPAGAGADAITYDPASRHVFVMNGKANSVTAIDPANNSVSATIALGGGPEFAVPDGQGKLYVNIESNSEIVRIDAKALKLEARWAIPECEAPHGLAIDPVSRRLFASCVNAKLVVVDADNGKVLATLPIGKGSDAVAFDRSRNLAFSSNGDGSLSMISGLSTLKPATTLPGARTMAVDGADGRLFLVSADVEKTETAIPPKHFVPGSVKLLFFDQD